VGTGPAAGRRRHDPLPERPRPPAPSSLDLHTHSLRSDGVLTPRALVDAAAAAGVRLLALADHDTLAGYRELVAPGADPLPLELVSAVEINAVARGLDLPDGELHILGYGMDPDDDRFEATIARQRDARRTRFERVVTRLRELGLPIDDQVARLDPSDDDALGRPTIGRCLVEAGHATSVDDAFRRLIGRGGPAYIPREGLGPTEAIDAIRAAGGIAALAHFGEAPARRAIVVELQHAGLRGLEVYYRAFDAPTVAAVGAVATELGLLPTGGSDYHGDTGSYGEQHAALWVPPEVGTGLLEALSTPEGATR
jgi:predicted metal-dependent phosphoesterase TrpH